MQKTPNSLLRQARLLHGWSQKQVAEMIGAPQAFSVNRWENGVAVPSPYYRQRLCGLFGKSAEELGLLRSGVVGTGDQGSQSGPGKRPLQTHWGEAPDIKQIHGRSREIQTLKQWIVQDRSKMVAVLGIGGVGKTLLATAVARELQEHFDALMWCSLVNAPPLETLLHKCLQFLAPERRLDEFSRLEDLVLLLLDYLQKRRVLLLLDNVESVLQTGTYVGPYRAEYEGYGDLFRRVGEMPHQSCLILTSRELPKELTLLEGESSGVRWYRLEGLALDEGEKLLREKRVQGTTEMRHALVSFYAGNPLAIRLVSQFIYEMYGGRIADFLKENQGIFYDVSDVLQQQFARLAPAEQEVMYWLAIRRVLVSLKELQEDFLPPRKLSELTEAARSLRRRSLVEQSTGRFTLQNVVMEFMTEKLVAVAYEEFSARYPSLLQRHALIQAQAQDYVRNAQVRQILHALQEKLVATYGRTETIRILLSIIADHRREQKQVPDYLAGNILNLLVHLEHDLSGADFSRLWIVQAYLRDIRLHQVDLSHTHIARTVFSETFGPLRSLAWHPGQDLLVTGATTGEFHLWDLREVKLLLAHRGHTSQITSVAFHPGETLFATASVDYSVRLWEVQTGRCLAIYQGHSEAVMAITFSPDGRYLASASADKSVCLWDVETGQLSKQLWGHTSWLQSVAFSPDGTLLASCALDNTVRIWDVTTGDCLQVIEAHESGCRTVAFHPQGTLLASAGGDGRVRVWDIEGWKSLYDFEGHKECVWSVAFHPDGHLLASGGEDQTVRLWDLYTGQICHILQGHTFAVRAVGFNAYGTLLASAGDDKMVRLWDIPDGQCHMVLQGYQQSVHTVALSPDAALLAIGSEDHLVQLWDMQGRCWLTPLQGHTYRVGVVRFSCDGKLLASASEDQTVRLWDIVTRQCIQVWHGSNGMVGSLAFSPDGCSLVSTSNNVTHLWDLRTREGRHFPSDGGNVAFHPDGHLLVIGAAVWDLRSATCVRTLAKHTGGLGEVAFSPDGTFFASCAGDGTIQILDTTSWKLHRNLRGHTNRTWSIAFHPAGTLLASGSEDQTIRIWDLADGQCLHVLSRHQGSVRAVAFSAGGDMLVSGSVDGMGIFWNVATGQPSLTVRSNRLYEGLNIHGASGLTDAQRDTLIALGAVIDAP